MFICILLVPATNESNNTNNDEIDDGDSGLSTSYLYNHNLFFITNSFK